MSMQIDQPRQDHPLGLQGFRAGRLTGGDPRDQATLDRHPAPDRAVRREDLSAQSDGLERRYSAPSP
jgi:hypothetical protein